MAPAVRAPRWMKLSKGKVVGDRLEITVTAPYCPCGGRCHLDRDGSPCSFDCLAHDEGPA